MKSFVYAFLVIFAAAATWSQLLARWSKFAKDRIFGYAKPSINSTTNQGRVLNVHIVPHTHDDVGWLKTVEQYYYGQNQTIQNASVQDILDSVVPSLLENPSRKFTYVEQKFFSMWWELQSDAIRDSVRYLVANKQLNFVNGGWCMHDEATTHYMGMIDQTTLGHSFLKRELGVIPKVGWQLDPFGHSSTQASLMTSKVGFDSIFFGRIDYQDLQLRQSKQECEGLWNASQSLSDTTVFWGLSGSNGGNYGAPPGFCYDVHCSRKENPLIIEMNETELLQNIEQFLKLIRTQSEQTKSKHIMLTMGSDFQYQRARINFANLDALINSVKNAQKWNLVNVSDLLGPQFDSVNMFYSSPEEYTRFKYEEVKSHQTNHRRGAENRLGLGVKRDDFFPYSDYGHAFWTGYFTSRSGFKRFERVASSFLLAARQIETYKNGSYGHCTNAFYNLEDGLGIAQHHDGVSGTAKQHVANDYSKRLQSGVDEVSACTSAKLRRVFLGEHASKYLKDLSLCHRINETICDVSQTATKEPNQTDVYVVVYNALGHAQSSVVLLPVSSAGTYEVLNVDSTDDDAKLVSSIPALKQTNEGASRFMLPLEAGNLPPVGASLFRVKLIDSYEARDFSSLPAGPQVDPRDLLARTRTDANGDVEYSNGLISVLFDGVTGTVKQMGTPGIALNVSHVFGYYTSYDSKLDKSDDKQNSGAYIFRPSTPEQELYTLKPSSVRFQNFSQCMEVHVEYEEGWVQSTFRVLPGLPYLEMEYTVGPIPVDDGRGKEIVTRFTSPIASSGIFYTDSNAREFLKRRRNYRPSWTLNVTEPIAGNYYPVNAAIYIEGGSGALAVATDRSQGGSSLQDGSIELMVHRRTLVDDARGVGEPMNETDGGVTPYPPYGSATRYGKGLVIRGKHRILVGNRNSGAALARSVMDAAFADPLVFVGSSPSRVVVPFQVSFFSGISRNLPRNVMLMTRLPLVNEGGEGGKGKVVFLIRLGHQYGVGEDEALSKPAEVDISLCVPGFKIVSIVETTLSGNQDYASWLKSRLDWTGGGCGSTGHAIRGNIVELMPLDIRTFKVAAVYSKKDRDSTLGIK